METSFTQLLGRAFGGRCVDIGHHHRGPCSASPVAELSPVPEAAPVTTATFFDRSITEFLHPLVSEASSRLPT